MIATTAWWIAALLPLAAGLQEKGVPSGTPPAAVVEPQAPAPAATPSPRAEPGLIPTQEWVKRETDPAKVATSIEIVIVMTVLSLAPALLMLLTSFTRIVIVLSFVRRALAVQDLPPNQVIFGLSMILTFLVMAPMLGAVKRDAIDPYTSERISQQQAIDRGTAHLREFMFRQARVQDVSLFMEITKQPPKEGGWTEGDVPTEVLIPAFVIGELRRAFVMGFALFLPFLVIDLVVSAVLMSMGMVMLPPVMVSLPFKLLLFILVDGWALVVGSLVTSFQGAA